MQNYYARKSASNNYDFFFFIYYLIIYCTFFPIFTLFMFSIKNHFFIEILTSALQYVKTILLIYGLTNPAFRALVYVDYRTDESFSKNT